MTMTLDQALALCEHASPMPHLAGQALRVLRDEIARIKTDEGLVSKAMVDDACTAYRLLMDHEDGPCEPAMRAALLAVLPNPPARAAQLWEMKQQACRAHALCNELRLAHPEIPELGDDGVLHEAIHDILRVDTPTAAPAQAAQVDEQGMTFIDGIGWAVQCSRAVEYAAVLASTADWTAEPVAQGEADAVERAAKAMWEVVPRGVPWSDEVTSANEWRMLARAALAAQPRALLGGMGEAANMRAPTLTRDQIHRHQIAAGECPPASMVLLVSSVQRMLATPPAQPAERVVEGPTKEDVDRAARYIFGDTTELDAQAVANALTDYHRRLLTTTQQADR